MMNNDNNDNAVLADVIAVAAGYQHSVALRRDGTVWAWGRDTHGALGQGHIGLGHHGVAPSQVPGIDGVTAIAAGKGFTLALRDDGTVCAWGDNEYGCLGNGCLEEVNPAPGQVLALTDIQAIAADGGHSLALRRDGTVWVWGTNGFGEVGREGRGRRGGGEAVPVRVRGLRHVVRIAAGENHCLVITEDGAVWQWGRYVEEDAGAEYSPARRRVRGVPGALDIAGGLFHSLVLGQDGLVRAWGSNYLGGLGDGITESSSEPVVVHSLNNVIAITAQEHHDIAIRNDGTVWIWGNFDTLDDITRPACVEGIDGIISVATGEAHAIALTRDGTVVTWGNNLWGQLGNGRSGPGSDISLPVVT